MQSAEILSRGGEGIKVSRNSRKEFCIQPVNYSCSSLDLTAYCTDFRTVNPDNLICHVYGLLVLIFRGMEGTGSSSVRVAWLLEGNFSSDQVEKAFSSCGGTLQVIQREEHVPQIGRLYTFWFQFSRLIQGKGKDTEGHRCDGFPNAESICVNPSWLNEVVSILVKVADPYCPYRLKCFVYLRVVSALPDAVSSGVL